MFTEADYNTVASPSSGDYYGYAKLEAEKLVVERCKVGPLCCARLPTTTPERTHQNRRPSTTAP